MARTAGSHADITGPKVREAALRLFARHGFAAVSMRQIAAEVGVQAGALYNYTPDKQSLLFALMQGHMEELLAAVGPALQGDAAARLEAFVRFHIQFHHDRQDAVFIAYMELRNLSEANFSAVEALRQRYEAVLEAVLRDGAETGCFDVAEPKVTTRALIAMLTGVSTWFRTGGGLSLRDVQDLYWGMVARAVGLR
ncbi:MAG: TetR/AcrR family transcriptional regulator [Pseudomonadota bacterium]